MDSFPHRQSSALDEFNVSFLPEEEDDVEEVEGHIHLPNPSYWPLLLGVAIGATIVGLLFVSSAPWVSLVGLFFVFVCIIGLGGEDPNAPIKEVFVPAARTEADHWKYKIGQNVVDAQGLPLGKVQARFNRYVLVERGRFLPRVYYVPYSVIKDQGKSNTLSLTLSEADLARMELNRVPDDLYDPEPEVGVPVVRGAAQFSRRPLSPAETGHYHYGKLSPGMNTDASGSYHREEVLPRPQTYVTEDVYSTDEPIPARAISPD